MTDFQQEGTDPRAPGLAGLAYRVLFNESRAVRVQRILRQFEDPSPPQPFAISQLLELLSRHGVAEILEGLLKVAQPLGIRTLRCDHLDRDPLGRELLTSFECAGFDGQTALRLRTGHVVAFRDQQVDQTRDAFCCIDEEFPVLLRLVSQGPPIHHVEIEDLSLYEVTRNDCSEVIYREPGDVWIDLPLLISGRVVGKLSCELEPGAECDARLVCDMLDLHTIVQAIAPAIELAYHHELEAPIGEVAVHISNCTRLEQLLDYCTRGISRLLECEYGSVLVASTDSLGCTKLILRRTSFPQSRVLEDRAFYLPSEDGITPWIFRKGVSLCLQDLGNDQLRLAKLHSYDPQVKWVNKIRDSNDSGDFLGVQLSNQMGVMRFTTKIPSARGRHFTARDQRLLETLAQRLIAPKLECLLQAESQRRVTEHLGATNTFSVQASAGFTSFASMLRSSMERLFPESPSGQKLWLFNLLKPGRGFRQMTLGGSLPGRPDAGFRLAGTLTQYALAHNGPVFLNSLSFAGERGAWDGLSDKAVCALACRVSMFDKKYGVLVVLSDRYDLSLQTHGQLLEMLAGRVAEVLLHRDAGRLAAELLGRRTVLALLPVLREQVHRMLLSNDGYLPAEGLRELDDLGLSARKVRLRRVLKTVASATALDHLHVRIGEDVVTSGPMAVRSGAILLNLLRQFAQWSGSSELSMTIDASIEQGSLRIVLHDDHGRIDLSLLRHLLQMDLSNAPTCRADSSQIGGLGIYEARRIVLERKGSLALENARLMVRLPCSN